MADRYKVVYGLSKGAIFSDQKLSFQGHAILSRWVSHKRLKIRPQLLWKANRKLRPSFQMVQPRFKGHDYSTSNGTT